MENVPARMVRDAAAGGAYIGEPLVVKAGTAEPEVMVARAGVAVAADPPTQTIRCTHVGGPISALGCHFDTTAARYSPACLSP